MNTWDRFDLDLDMLVYADVHGLILKGKENVISLTEKGKEFIKLYSKETNTYL